MKSINFTKKLFKKLAIFGIGNVAYFVTSTVILGLAQVILEYGNQKLYLVMFIIGAIWTLFAQLLWKILGKRS